jgi:hypothetical protein
MVVRATPFGSNTPARIRALAALVSITTCRAPGFSLTTPPGRLGELHPPFENATIVWPDEVGVYLPAGVERDGAPGSAAWCPRRAHGHLLYSAGRLMGAGFQFLDKSAAVKLSRGTP